MVTTFETLLVALLSLGLIVSFWGMKALLSQLRKQPAALDRISSFLAYTQTVDRIWDEINKEVNLAPIVVAGIRNLRMFPEYREATILLVDQIHVTGDSHFDQLLKRELTELENHLLKVAND